MTFIFYICAILAFFVVLHGLVNIEEAELAFVIGIVLFLTCIWIANQHDITVNNPVKLEEVP